MAEVSRRVDGAGSLNLESIFKINGVPDFTFVQPSRWATLLVNLRTPGRGLVVEGPSGIGKTTAVKKALSELGLGPDAQYLSARRPADAEIIEILPDLDGFGLVVVDDFHVLKDDVRARLADLLKALADAEDPTSKLVIIGINRAGERLIDHAPDLVNRLDIIRLDIEPSSKIAAVISLGEKALNVSIEARDSIIEASHGSFYLAQLLCHEICTESGVLSSQNEHLSIDIPYARVKRLVLSRQEVRLEKVLTRFARGNKFRPGGRAPYVYILRWLQQENSWAISLREAMALDPTSRASVNVVLKNGYLANLVSDSEISKILHFDPVTSVLSLEDPQVAFYIRNLDLAAWAKKIGFRKINFSTSYDVALSFAGEDREFAELLNDQLEERGVVVFYDLNQQARILGEDLERFFAPIYEAEASYVVAVLGPNYGVKRWTRFESEAFKDRFDQGCVIPIWSTAVSETAWDKTRTRGGCEFDPSGNLHQQAIDISELIASKVGGDD